jgi:hypothetical protein
MRLNRPHQPAAERTNSSTNFERETSIARRYILGHRGPPDWEQLNSLLFSSY